MSGRGRVPRAAGDVLIILRILIVTPALISASGLVAASVPAPPGGMAVAGAPAPTQRPIRVQVDDIVHGRIAYPEAGISDSGGRINGLAMAADGSAVYAASEWGGLFKSTDSGRTWSHLPSHEPTIMWDVAVDPDNPLKVYATSMYDGRVDSRAGINVSDDGGLTWIRPATALPPAGFCDDRIPEDEPAAFGIALDPEDPERVFIGTYCGLAISEDAGGSWRYVSPIPGRAYRVWDVVAHHDTADGHLILDICGNGVFFRTEDLGMSWRPARTGAGVPPFGRCSIAAAPDEQDVLFVVTGTTIYDSIDGGLTWQTTLTNPRAQGRIPFVATNRRSFGGFDLWFGDVLLSRVACATAPGSSEPRCPAGAWIDAGAGAHADAGTLLFEPGVTVDACPLFYSNDGGVHDNIRTTAPDCHDPRWQKPDDPPAALWVKDLAGAHQPDWRSEDLYAGLQDNAAIYTGDPREPTPGWTKLGAGDVYDVEASPGTVVFGSYVGDSATIADRGLTRLRALANHPPGLRRMMYMPGESFARIDGDAYVFLTDAGVYTTADITAATVTWQPLGSANMPTDACHVVVSRDAASGDPVFFVETGDCFPWAEGQLWRHDGLSESGSWSMVPLPSAGSIGVFDADPDDARRILASFFPAGGAPRMILTTDGAMSWNDVPALQDLMTAAGQYKFVSETGYTNYSTTDGTVQPTLVAFDPEDGNVVVAGGADTGVFLSLDAGMSWQRISGLPGRADHIPRPQFAYFDHEAPLGSTDHELTLFIGSTGRGVWRLDVSNDSGGGGIGGCFATPSACLTPGLFPGLIDLSCPAGNWFDCRFIDPFPQNCLVKYPCPGCPPDGLCPPWYQVFFEDLDPAVWNVGIFTRDGQPVPFQRHDLSATSTVLSFRPDEQRFIDGSVGEYVLGFWMTPNGQPGVYRIPTRLERSDGPYDPQR